MGVDGETGLAEEANENECPNSQQPLRSAIRARLEHLNMADMGPMPGRTHEHTTKDAPEDGKLAHAEREVASTTSKTVCSCSS